MTNPPSTQAEETLKLPEQLLNCLSIDLEIDEQSRLTALAAWRPDTGDELHFQEDHARRPESLQRVDRMSQNASFLLGHNIIKFDIPHLRATSPSLELLNLPAVDTLWLNPLAYPKRPYHRLVKHYKDAGLVRSQRNNPLLDSKLAFQALTNQAQQFLEMTPEMLATYHHLCTARGEPGPELVFTSLRKAPRPNEQAGAAAIRNLLQDKTCPTHLEQAIAQIPRIGWEIAFATAWITIEERDSSLAPWVLHQFPETHNIIRSLRATACTNPNCQWCLKRHDPKAELKRWFGFEEFRAEPSTPEGLSIQKKVVTSALAQQDQLAILPTGSGKSLCYQLPALIRYDQTGDLTVVISPLVALMEDQVRSMQQVHMGCVTINSMLAPQERMQNLNDVRQGQAAILLISPEQLRNRTVNSSLETRKVGLWVLDEAHCLSKWGHDFRPDYRYIGRWLRNHHPPEERGAVLCLTATAKPDVEKDITDYFTDTLQKTLEVVDGGAERHNLDFVVVPTTKASRLDHISQLLREELDLDDPNSGGAIIYCSRRKGTEDVAEFLNQQGIPAERFHAGISGEEKRDIQERFVSGELRILSATSAFGMGIDRPDIRLILHSDMPGSLENYIQEAGRAGRDQQHARCVLLYTPDDTEEQFSLNARARISRNDIDAVLRALRQLEQRNNRHQSPDDQTNGNDGALNPRAQVVATPGEILAEDQEQDFQRDGATDDTRVRTAVAWLEEASLAARLENDVRMHPSSLRVPGIAQARERLRRIRGLTPQDQTKALDIVRRLLNAGPTEGISTDELADLTGLNSRQVQGIISMLDQAGVLSNDQAVTCFVHQGVSDQSTERYHRAAAMERDLIQLMQEQAPDQEVGGPPLDLQLQATTSALKRAGHTETLPLRVQNCLQSISRDSNQLPENNSANANGNEPTPLAPQGSIRIRNSGKDTIQVSLRQEWSQVEDNAQQRRDNADRILQFLVKLLPQGTRGKDLLVTTTRGALAEALSQMAMPLQTGNNPSSSLQGRQQSQHRGHDQKLNAAILWLHQQEIIRLNQGMGIFTPAMTIRMEQTRSGFTEADYQPLQQYYDTQTLQIHIMAEYARQGLDSATAAVRLTMDYFTMQQNDFLKKWLPNREAELKRQTSQDSYRKIVTDLNHRTQQAIVSDNRVETNVLIMAGPGAGKTRVLVHRIAYLVRCCRERPESIIALAYNRHAAVQIRQRLQDLIGNDAQGVLVMTLHSLAMRLTGETFAQAPQQHAPNTETGADAGAEETSDDNPDRYFRAMLERAVALLGERNTNGRNSPDDFLEQDQLRDRLLGGFRWILVDEYQDMNDVQYRLIRALSGSARIDPGQKLTTFAVGDDDQNIYSFQGASTEYIRRFEDEYSARKNYLTENYRSTKSIISAANHAIEPAQHRMKADEPIRINRSRQRDQQGGRFRTLDPVGQGRVQILPGGADHVTQGLMALRELRRLENQDPEAWNWSRVAIIGRNWRELETVAGLCQTADIDVQLAHEDFTATWQLRETQALLEGVWAHKDQAVSVEILNKLLAEQPSNRWTDVLQTALDEYVLEVGEASQPASEFVHWLGEWCREIRRRQNHLLITTAHRAKGREFDHVVVLDGDWGRTMPREDADAPRRLFYVAMTRARDTLTLISMDQPSKFVAELKNRPEILKREPPAEWPQRPDQLPALRRRLRLSEVNLSFAGGRGPKDRLHLAIANLQPGDPLEVDTRSTPWQLKSQGITVGNLARKFDTRDLTNGRHPNTQRENQPASNNPRIEASVLAIAAWNRDKSEGQHRTRLRSHQWEVVIPEILVYFD